MITKYTINFEGYALESARIVSRNINFGVSSESTSLSSTAELHRKLPS